AHDHPAASQTKPKPPPPPIPVGAYPIDARSASQTVVLGEQTRRNEPPGNRVPADRYHLWSGVRERAAAGHAPAELPNHRLTDFGRPCTAARATGRAPELPAHCRSVLRQAVQRAPALRSRARKSG